MYILFPIDVILAGTYFTDSNPGYGAITLSLVIISTVVVQIFSVRWHQMDGFMNKGLWVAHAFGMGVIHR